MTLEELKQKTEAALANQPNYKEDGWDPWWDSKVCNEFLAFAATPATVLKLLEIITTYQLAAEAHAYGDKKRGDWFLRHAAEIERSL